MAFLRGIFGNKQGSTKKNSENDPFPEFGGQIQEENTYMAVVTDKNSTMPLKATLGYYDANPEVPKNKPVLEGVDAASEAYVFQFTMSEFNLDDLMFRLEQKKTNVPDAMDVSFFDSEGKRIAPPIIQEPVEELNAQYV